MGGSVSIVGGGSIIGVAGGGFFIGGCFTGGPVDAFNIGGGVLYGTPIITGGDSNTGFGWPTVECGGGSLVRVAGAVLYGT